MQNLKFRQTLNSINSNTFFLFFNIIWNAKQENFFFQMSAYDLYKGMKEMYDLNDSFFPETCLDFITSKMVNEVAKDLL